ncbi:MAG: HAMP domain-containing sensor histidine kinase [Eubacteriales bacterium]|nr:HAMP domain-containing sensor histidine kinase [Eubacteriales bacterium]
MFHKVHLQLTFLCLGITALILGIMSVSYLYISEKNLKETYFSSFQSDMNTLLSNLEHRTVISHRWLSQMEGNGKYIIDIQDNGVHFLWGTQNGNPSENRNAVIESGWKFYESRFQTESPSDAFSIYHQEFAFASAGAGTPDYYGCAAFSLRETGLLSILVLEPLAPLNRQIRSQRVTFAALIFICCIVLGIFSWYFTGRLLAPIEQSRQSQSRFIAAASHELRTPLSVILSAASACKKANSSEQDKFFDIIQEEGESMSRLISDLLMLAGADSRTALIRKEDCEADTLLLNFYEAFEPLARERGYLLTIFLPDKKIAPVRCDSDRIRQVLSILIHNAFSYTPPGSRIRLSLAETAENLLLQWSRHSG